MIWQERPCFHTNLIKLTNSISVYLRYVVLCFQMIYKISKLTFLLVVAFRRYTHIPSDLMTSSTTEMTPTLLLLLLDATVFASRMFFDRRRHGLEHLYSSPIALESDPHCDFVYIPPEDSYVLPCVYTAIVKCVP